MQYAQAVVRTPALARQARSVRQDSTAVFRTLTEFAGGYFRPVQVESEFVLLLDRVRELQPRVIVEIGTVFGGTLLSYLTVAPDDAMAVSIDLPGGKFGGGYSKARAKLFRSFAPGRVHCLRMDSHSPATAEALNQVLAGRAVDFLFIDGDHSYAGVKQDFEMYSPLVRPGGLIAFHDVARNDEDTQVKVFWDEVKVGRKATEYVHPADWMCGIGVLDWEGS